MSIDTTGSIGTRPAILRAVVGPGRVGWDGIGWWDGIVWHSKVRIAVLTVALFMALC